MNGHFDMHKSEIKHRLIEKLKAENALWSYNQESVKDIPDDILVELVMLHLDIEDIDKLFELYSFERVKRAWIENVVVLGEMYYVLNKFFAWYYFHIKRPETYVKSMLTRQINKKFLA